MSNVLTVINDKCRARMELEIKKTELATQEKIINKEIAEIEKFITDALQAESMKSITTEFGKFTVKVDSYATIKDQDQLMQWLKDKNLFDSLAKLNATTMNAFYKAEEEKAMEAGDLDFAIPGMEVTSSRIKLSITEKKTFKVGDGK